MTDFLSIYMTAASEDEAEKIALALVNEKIVACVNIFPGVRSIYHWEGKLRQETEVVMIAKARKEHFERLKNLVKTLHSYSCPCIVGTPITVGHQPYLAWLVKETTS